MKDSPAAFRVRAAISNLHREGHRSIPLGNGDLLYLADLYALLDAHVVVNALPDAALSLIADGGAKAALARIAIYRKASSETDDTTAGTDEREQEGSAGCPCGCPFPGIPDMCCCPEPCPCTPDCEFCDTPNAQGVAS